MAFPTDPELSISHTQLRQFDSCPRQWWIGAVGQWEGWNSSAADSAGKAYRLKKLEPAGAWAGKQAHAGISRLLNEPTVSADAIANEIAESMRWSFQRSAMVGTGEFGSPKEFRLAEHFFGTPLSAGYVEESIQEVREILDSFEIFCRDHAELDFRRLAAEARRSSRFVRIDDASIAFDERKYRTSLIGRGEVSIYASPDFVVEIAPRRFLVIDWKTGQASTSSPGELSPQLLGYLIWLRLAPDLISEPPLRAELFEFHLPECREVGRLAFEHDVQRTIQEYHRRAELLLELRGDHKRVPIESCPPAPKRARCATCVFRQVCRTGHDLLKSAET